MGWISSSSTFDIWRYPPLYPWLIGRINLWLTPSYRRHRKTSSWYPSPQVALSLRWQVSRSGCTSQRVQASPQSVWQRRSWLSDGHSVPSALALDRIRRWRNWYPLGERSSIIPTPRTNRQYYVAQCGIYNNSSLLDAVMSLSFASLDSTCFINRHWALHWMFDGE